MNYFLNIIVFKFIWVNDRNEFYQKKYLWTNYRWIWKIPRHDEYALPIYSGIVCSVATPILITCKDFLKGKIPGGLIYINQLGPVNSLEDFVFSLFKSVRSRPLGSYFIPRQSIECAYSWFIQIVSQFNHKNVWHACNRVIRKCALTVNWCKCAWWTFGRQLIYNNKKTND